MTSSKQHCEVGEVITASAELGDYLELDYVQAPRGASPELVGDVQVAHHEPRIGAGLSPPLDRGAAGYSSSRFSIRRSARRRTFAIGAGPAHLEHGSDGIRYCLQRFRYCLQRFRCVSLRFATLHRARYAIDHPNCVKSCDRSVVEHRGVRVWAPPCHQFDTTKLAQPFVPGCARRDRRRRALS